MTPHVQERPNLRIVDGPAPRPSRRAVEFIQWAVDEFGAPGQLAGTVVIERSQRELALANDEVDSAGTVAYYVRKLRDAGVILRTGPIVVDVDVMDQLASRTSSTHSGDEPSPRHARLQASTLPDPAPAGLPLDDLAALLIREAELEADLAQVRADVSAARALNLRAALCTAQDQRECANPGLAQSAGNRAKRESDPRERKKVGVPSLEIDQPPTFLERDRANDDPRIRAGRSRTPVERTSFDEVDEIVSPLIEWCRANNRETFFNDQGRQALSQYGRDGLQHAVEVAIKEAAADPGIYSPLGRLYHQATSGVIERFTPQPAAPAPARPRPVINDCHDCGGSGRRYTRDSSDPSTTRCDCVAPSQGQAR